MKSLICIIAALTMTFTQVPEFAELPSQIMEVVHQEENSYYSITDGIQFFYKEKDKNAYEIVVELLKELPEHVKTGVGEIHFEGKNDDIAGTAGGSVITLYDFMSYSRETRKDILFHEVGHTFGNVLKYYRIIDSNYTDYSEYAKKDKNYVSDYSKGVIKREGKYSEDFADAFSQYFMNNARFKRKFKNRYEYLNRLITEIDFNILREEMKMENEKIIEHCNLCNRKTGEAYEITIYENEEEKRAEVIKFGDSRGNFTLHYECEVDIVNQLIRTIIENNRLKEKIRQAKRNLR